MVALLALDTQGREPGAVDCRPQSTLDGGMQSAAGALGVEVRRGRGGQRGGGRRRKLWDLVIPAEPPRSPRCGPVGHQRPLRLVVVAELFSLSGDLRVR